MKPKINRRDFVVSGTAAGLSLALPVPAGAGAPAVHVRSAAMPLVIASGNGNRYRNGGTQTAVEKAYSMMMGGAVRASKAWNRA